MVVKPISPRGIPRTIWALGFVSMFTDISSEMIHSLLAVFLVSVLNASATSIGLIEGVAEATALITRGFSGALSDWLGKRKALTLVGYGLGALTKPLFAIASGVRLIFMARFLDRLGKGVRGAPRDALVADATPLHLRGAAYGLRQSLDTIGAFLGPLIAIGLMIAARGDFRSVFWVALIPGLLSVGILAFAVREPVNPGEKPTREPICLHDIVHLGSLYWTVLAFGSVFNMARFSEAFLLLRAENVGMAASVIPVILIIMNIFYSLTAYPAGHLSDRLGRTGVIATGLFVLIISDLTFAFAKTGWQVAFGAAIWGLHMGLTQGVLAAMMADATPQHLRGTAFGMFSLASGIAMLVASLIAGSLWDRFGASATFYAGGVFAACAFLGFIFFYKRLK